MALINALPQPTPGFLNSSNQNHFIDYPSTPTNQRKDTYGGDWNINEKMQFRFRGQVYSDHVVSWSDTYVVQPQNNPNKRGSINYVYTISPTWVNEVLLTASGDHVYTSIETGPQGSSQPERGSESTTRTCSPSVRTTRTRFRPLVTRTPATG